MNRRVTAGELLAAGEYLHDLTLEYELVPRLASVTVRHKRCGTEVHVTAGSFRYGVGNVIPVTEVVLWMLEHHAPCLEANP
jgi:hypothetical protein